MPRQALLASWRLETEAVESRVGLITAAAVCSNGVAPESAERRRNLFKVLAMELLHKEDDGEGGGLGSNGSEEAATLDQHHGDCGRHRWRREWR